MEEIRFQQINAPRPMTGKSFLLGVAAVLLRLAIAQILCNLLITATGVGLLNIASCAKRSPEVPIRSRKSRWFCKNVWATARQA